MSITFKRTVRLSSQGCEDETAMYQRNRHRGWEVCAPACLTTCLPAWWPPPTRWEKTGGGGKRRRKHPSEMVWERKVWSGGNIRRGNGISLEEAASLLYLMRWRRNREQVKRKYERGGNMEDEIGQREDDEGTETGPNGRDIFHT